MSEEVARRVADLVTEALTACLAESYETGSWTDARGMTTIEVTDRAGRPKCRVRVFP